MATTVWGIVREGVVRPETSLPEGVRVQILLPDAAPNLPPELQAEFDAWDLASAQTLADVERLALEDGEPTLALTPDEQLAFWKALNETPTLTSAQRRLGSMMRGES